MYYPLLPSQLIEQVRNLERLSNMQMENGRVFLDFTHLVIRNIIESYNLPLAIDVIDPLTRKDLLKRRSWKLEGSIFNMIVLRDFIRFKCSHPDRNITNCNNNWKHQYHTKNFDNYQKGLRVYDLYIHYISHEIELFLKIKDYV